MSAALHEKPNPGAVGHRLLSFAITAIVLCGLVVAGRMAYDAVGDLAGRFVAANEREAQLEQVARISVEAFATEVALKNDAIAVESFDPTGNGVVVATVENAEACAAYMRAGAPQGFWFHLADGAVLGTAYMQAYRRSGTTVYPILRACEVQDYPTTIMAKRYP